MQIFNAAAQRAALLEFAKALGSIDIALRRDECGDWAISGLAGHLYAIPGGFQFFVFSGSKQAWAHAKKALAFARLCNDGDDEGGFVLDRHPTKTEAKTIRHYCRIHKRHELSARHVESLKERLRVWQKTALAA
jgi:hypothetical protein